MQYYRIICLTLILFWLSPKVAMATPERPSNHWDFSVEAVTDFPLQVGASVVADAPNGLRLYSSVGVLPSPYLETIHAVSEAAGWYDPMTSELISAALENSLVWKLRAGFRAPQESGFYAVGGYALVALGGGLSGAELISTLTNKALPASTRSERNLTIDCMAHMVDLEAGWEWALYNGLIVRAGLGASITVYSSTDITPSWTPKKAAKVAVDELSDAGEAYLDDIIQSYIHSAVISLAVGWRF